VEPGEGWKVDKNPFFENTFPFQNPKAFWRFEVVFSFLLSFVVLSEINKLYKTDFFLEGLSLTIFSRFSGENCNVTSKKKLVHFHIKRPFLLTSFFVWLIGLTPAP
jgi:hypothetical protein